MHNNPLRFYVKAHLPGAVDSWLDARRAEAGMYDVPCNGCTKCCHGDAIRLLPQDDATQYQTEPHDWMPGHLMLAHAPNGDCVYLGAGGCTIQSTKPLMCREMDCRRIAQAVTYTQARKMAATGRLRIDVWQRGRELLRSAEQP